MRPTPWLTVERHRLSGPMGGEYGWDAGAFAVPHPPTAVTLRVIASAGFGWEHVSVSLPNRTPNWREMEFVCRLFWTEDECVMQLHPPRSGRPAAFRTRRWSGCCAMAEPARWLTREALANHVGVRVDYVARLVKAGKLPPPSHHLGPKCPRWDRGQVDAVFEGGIGSGPRGMDHAVQQAVEDILRGG